MCSDLCPDNALEVRNLSKAYRIYAKPRDRLLQMLARDKHRYYQEFWALRGVSFEVRRGETVGIVGRNGSGKSTLLQIICNTLRASGGEVRSQGRIAALLELGAGFSPEFTGRENVYINASILGLSKAEVDARYESIAAFAAIGDFIEQPVKTYSSGMLVRLAFAVAVNVEPQVLVVDEALAVGDELFQRKCFARIDEIKRGGATILFVSHSGPAVVDLCDRALLLDQGELLAAGAPKTILGNYQRLLYAPAEEQAALRQAIQAGELAGVAQLGAGLDGAAAGAPTLTQAVDDDGEWFDPHLQPQSTIAYASRGAVISDCRVERLDGRPVNVLLRGRRYRFSYEVWFPQPAARLSFGMLIKSLSGVEIGGATSSPATQATLDQVAAGTRLRVAFAFDCRLNPGTYYLNAGVLGEQAGEDGYLHRILDASLFRVLPCEQDTATCLVDFGCTLTIEPVSDAASSPPATPVLV
ncbi:MAG: ABC transporter ATP-binding protein [Chromatiaceae bacterium]|nr:ABC transporter ATP-binding protein [Chromatiaceae bacterium]